jgi:hypothetical protein
VSTTEYDVQYCRFLNGGGVGTRNNVAGTLATNTVWKHNHNWHIGSVGPYCIRPHATTAIGTGAREIIGTSCDGQVALPNFSLRDFTIQGNWIDGLWTGSVDMAAFSENYVRARTQGIAMKSLTATGRFENNYLMRDSEIETHYTQHTLAGSVTFAGNILDTTGTLVPSAGQSDGFVFSNPTAANTTITMENNVIVPPPVSTVQVGTPLESFGSEAFDNGKFVIRHNVAHLAGAAAIEIPHANATSGKKYISIARSNIFWDWSIRDQSAGAGGGGALTLDLADAAGMDHNCMVQVNTPDAPTYGHTVPGYMVKLSGTPGTGDVAQDPQLKDPRRTVAFWDRDYLHHTDTAEWSSYAADHAFAVGDVVAYTNATYWGGHTVNFRCIAAHARNAANSEPMAGAQLTGTTWRSYWELASEYDLREAIWAGTAYTDAAIGCTGCSPVQAVSQWVRAGNMAQAVALKGAGENGEDIGAWAITIGSSANALMFSIP